MKKAIIILIILLCIAIIVLIVFNVIQNSNGRQEYLTINGADQYEFSNQMEKVTSYHSYTAVNNCINTYLRKIYYANHTELTENESDPQTPEEIREDIYNILYKPYIEENDVNTENILTKVYNLNDRYVMNITDIRVIESDRIQTYYVCGEIEEGQPLYLIVYIDDYNATFAIQPLNNQYENIEQINVTREIEKIDSNNANKVLYSETSDQTICTHYLMDYKQKLLNDVELAYNLLDEEYREKRFQNLTNFQEYLVDSADIIDKITLNAYQVNAYDDYMEYICQDVYENYYVFHVTSVLEYTVKLDIYTISDTFDETYEKSGNNIKAALNIEKFFQMINARDYLNAYEVLDETFRSQNFATYEQFKNYVQETFYTVNNVSYADYQTTQDLHIYEITIEDKNNPDAQAITKNFIVKLLDGTDFVMSFSV